VKTDEHVLQELVVGFHGGDRDADLAGDGRVVEDPSRFAGSQLEEVDE
jgi:hypothetical protein